MPLQLHILLQSLAISPSLVITVISTQSHYKAALKQGYRHYPHIPLLPYYLLDLL